MKILVVDDSTTMRRIIKNTVTRLGYSDVQEACDGLEALNLIKKDNSFDLVLTDWNMPKMNGLSLVETIRADKRFENTPIIMITTEGQKTSVIDALNWSVLYC